MVRREAARKRYNDQAHPPPEAEATGGTTKAQAVGGRVQRLVGLVVDESRGAVWCNASRTMEPKNTMRSRKKTILCNADGAIERNQEASNLCSLCQSRKLSEAKNYNRLILKHLLRIT